MAVDRLLEPEVWIEFLRLDKQGALVSGINGITPENVTVRASTDRKTGDQMWEYLM